MIPSGLLNKFHSVTNHVWCHLIYLCIFNPDQDRVRVGVHVPAQDPVAAAIHAASLDQGQDQIRRVAVESQAGAALVLVQEAGTKG